MERPKILKGQTEVVESPRGRVYVTINSLGSQPYEVFIKAKDDEAPALGRMIALCLKNNVSVDEIVEQLWRIESREIVRDVSTTGKAVPVKSVAQAVALALGRYVYGPDWAGPYGERLEILNGIKDSLEKPKTKDKIEICPECGSVMVFQEGCRTCFNCGYAKCS